jgi:hypothetical protein
MGNYKEDTNQDFRTIFLIILFSVFVLATSDNPGSHISPSANYISQNDLASGDSSGNCYAILCYAASLPDLQKYCEGALRTTSLNPFSIQNKISDYNRRISQNFILIQKTRLSTEPVLLLRLYYHLPSNKDDDLPFLG